MSPSNPDLERVYLTGYMGAGKSTIGRLLALKMGYRFLDTDRQLVKQCQKTISEIFAEEGEEFFRQSELSLLTELAQQNKLIISTGGGTLTRPQTLEIANQSGSVIVYLRAPIETLFERVIFSPKDRPMIDVPNAEEVFRQKFQQRETFYNSAHFSVDTADKQPSEVAGEIYNVLMQSENIVRENKDSHESAG